MRCSSCEPLLDRYVEGTLTPRQMADVTTHLRGCEHCRALIQELKVVDGLLLTTRPPELPQNFTFAVMAEVNALPAPRRRQHPVWSFLALYSAAAWVAVVLGVVLTGNSPAAVAGRFTSVFASTGAAASAFAANASHGFDRTMPALAAFGAGVLLVDIAIAAAAALLYFVVRPRLAARLAASPEISP